jgi:hypothetical protein
MSVEVVVPEEYMGEVIGDLTHVVAVSWGWIQVLVHRLSALWFHWLICLVIQLISFSYTRPCNLRDDI